MKKPFRSVTSLLLTVVMLSAILVPASAAQVIGSVLATDIRAYINGAEIPAYNIDGKLAIIVSDLNNYGFTTQYNNDLRKSIVTRNLSASSFTSVPSKASGLPIGTPVMSVYASDITVELDGRQVQAFNVDNRMAIYFTELKEYGDYGYDNTNRASVLNLSYTIPTREQVYVPPVAPVVPITPIEDYTGGGSGVRSQGSTEEGTILLGDWYAGIPEYDAEGHYIYIVNKNSGKIHYQWCESVNKMKDSNKKITTMPSSLIASNPGKYDLCENCH